MHIKLPSTSHRPFIAVSARSSELPIDNNIEPQLPSTMALKLFAFFITAILSGVVVAQEVSITSSLHRTVQ